MASAPPKSAPPPQSERPKWGWVITRRALAGRQGAGRGEENRRGDQNPSPSEARFHGYLPRRLWRALAAARATHSVGAGSPSRNDQPPTNGPLVMLDDFARSDENCPPTSRAQHLLTPRLGIWQLGSASPARSSSQCVCSSSKSACDRKRRVLQVPAISRHGRTTRCRNGPEFWNSRNAHSGKSKVILARTVQNPW